MVDHDFFIESSLGGRKVLVRFKDVLKIEEAEKSEHVPAQKQADRLTLITQKGNVHTVVEEGIESIVAKINGEINAAQVAYRSKRAPK